jgi:hypothetical protein
MPRIFRFRRTDFNLEKLISIVFKSGLYAAWFNATGFSALLFEVGDGGSSDFPFLAAAFFSSLK